MHIPITGQFWTAPAARVGCKDPYTTTCSHRVAEVQYSHKQINQENSYATVRSAERGAAPDTRKRATLFSSSLVRQLVKQYERIAQSSSIWSDTQPNYAYMFASVTDKVASPTTHKLAPPVSSSLVRQLVKQYEQLSQPSSTSFGVEVRYGHVSASDMERLAPLATRKRHYSLVDTTDQMDRNVRARLKSHRHVMEQKTDHRDRDVDRHWRVASQKSELGAYSPTSVESRDSHTTVVDDTLHTRRIARPSRAFASLHVARALSPFEDAPQAEEDTSRVEDAAKSKKSRNWDDLDGDDKDDPMMVSEYIDDIIGYLKEIEPRSMPDSAYMDKQMDLTWDMRRALVIWIIQIHYHFRMLPETLFLAVNLIDRFLSKRLVSVTKLQLVGIAGLIIASKYEGPETPDIKDFLYLCANTYTRKDILAMESSILQVLGHDMSYPNPMTFLRRVSKAEQYNVQSRTVAKYLMEVCLVDHRLMAFPPSHIAAAGICLARRMLHSGEWDTNMRHFSGFEEAELQPCVNLMANCILCARDDESVFKKYSTQMFLRASLFCREWVGKHRDEFELTGHQS